MSQNPPASAPISVLVVEDDPDDLLLIRDFLAEAPGRFQIETARRLSAALERLSAAPIDLIVADLSLPDSQGLDTFRALFAHRARAPILVISGLDDEALAVRTVEEGAQDYLVKGQFDSSLLVRSIRYALQRAAAEKALQDERNLLRNVIDNLLDSIYVKDADGRYLLGNAAHTRQLGIASPEEVLGRTALDFFPADIARGFQTDDQQVMGTGTPIIDRQESAGGNPAKWLSTTKVPLRDANGRIIGIVGIGRDITARKLAEEKLERYAEELRGKNAEMEDDLQMAREVQQAFLPQQFPSFPANAASEESALRFFSRYLPTTTLGGDFFHVQPISDTRVGVFICDVMGHGVRAALVTAIQRTLVEELQTLADQPGEFLTQMNAALLSILRRTNSPLFASAFYLVADLAAGTLRFANAGHPRPLHLRRDLHRVEKLGPTTTKPGPALGVFEGSVYQTQEALLAPRDLVLLFTDGLCEAEGACGELFDQALLERIVEQRLDRGAEELFSEMLDEVRHFSATGEFGDDVCLVGLEVQRLLPQA
ncbi:MAG: phosphoserine phosphatase RsbU/P [Chthoniobacter sp.]|jgi:sigma-B regulation protein RsbU (phosphoserine phosphatase)|nr:phosphoserine phosphatase RsbU/P [Chthoniobacter sp.]